MSSTYSPPYQYVIKWLANQRHISKITQTELSLMINKPQSFVSKYENGERRLDIVEFVGICAALNAGPSELINALLNKEYD